MKIKKFDFLWQKKIVSNRQKRWHECFQKKSHFDEIWKKHYIKKSTIRYWSWIFRRLLIFEHVSIFVSIEIEKIILFAKNYICYVLLKIYWKRYELFNRRYDSSQFQLKSFWKNNIIFVFFYIIDKWNETITIYQYFRIQ